jgi:small GTP-binding protein
MGMTNPPSIKAALVGDSGVGKTAIFNRIQEHMFSDTIKSTVGGSFARMPIAVTGGTEVNLGLWDTAGQERFRTIVPMYFQRANVLLYVFDLTNQLSFDNIDLWTDIAGAVAPREAQSILIGNKDDLDARQIKTPIAREKAREIGAGLYLEISAKTGAGFDILLAHIARIAQQPDTSLEVPAVLGDDAGGPRECC